MISLEPPSPQSLSLPQPCKPSFIIVAFETLASTAAAAMFYRATEKLASASLNTLFMKRARKVHHPHPSSRLIHNSIFAY
jgi:hypothetical protein